jgi:hypothetical protein
MEPNANVMQSNGMVKLYLLPNDTYSPSCVSKWDSRKNKKIKLNNFETSSYYSLIDLITSSAIVHDIAGHILANTFLSKQTRHKIMVLLADGSAIF